MRLGTYLHEKADIFGKDAEYTVKETGSNEYKVYKWTHGKNPVEEYTCSHYPKTGKWHCTCPDAMRTKGNCKHTAIVKEWLKEGKPNPYDPKDASALGKWLFGGK